MHKIVRETAWVLTGQVLAALGTLVGIRIITEVARPDVYGAAILAIGIVLLAQGLAATPLMQAVLRMYRDYASRRGEGHLRKEVIRALTKSTALLSGAVVIAASLSQQDPITGLLVGACAAILLVVEVARAVELNFLNAAREHRPMALLIALDAWLRPLLAFVTVLAFGESPIAIIVGYIAGTLIALCAVRSVVRRSPIPRPTAGTEADGLDESTQRGLWGYARPLVALAVVGWTAGQIDRYIIAGIMGTHTAGVYAAIYGLVARPFLMAANTVELAIRQVYYEAVTDHESAKARKILKKWLVVVAVLAVSLLTLFGIAHSEIAALFLAEEYRQYSPLMVWIATGYCFAALSLVVERVCYALHDTKGVFLIHASGAITSVVVGLPMITYLGTTGASVTVSLCFGIQLTVAVARAVSISRRYHSPRVART